ncbi:MAG: hypothetical protein H7240_00970 [Glaciimonas sp.]|nr:hypothetical protein [Glaciimonas sp.]
MLGLEPEELDMVAKLWIKDCNHGFVVTGVPHRKSETYRISSESLSLHTPVLATLFEKRGRAATDL